MSLRAMLWVMESAPVENHGELAVLYALAERAHDDGSCAWPSQEWIAWRARCTDRTVRNHLKALEQRGVIRRGNPKFVEHIRRDLRPIVWDLDLTLQRPENNDRKNLPGGKSGSNDRKIQAERPENLGRTTGNGFPTNRPEPSMNRPEPLSAPGGAHGYPDDFNEFFQEYPRKTDKQGALKRYKEQLEVTDHETLMRSVRNFRAETIRLQTEQRYIPMCKTWLNQGRWRDFVDYAPKLSGKEKLDRMKMWKEELLAGDAEEWADEANDD